jgi:hypothetical protein
MTICALTPNRDAVFRYDGFGTSWTRIGLGPVIQLFGGEFGLVRTDPPNGDLLLWRPDSFHFVSNAWHPIGGPGASFAVTGDTVYGLTPDRGAVFRYDGSGTSWTQVGGPAHSMVACSQV